MKKAIKWKLIDGKLYFYKGHRKGEDASYYRKRQLKWNLGYPEVKRVRIHDAGWRDSVFELYVRPKHMEGR